MSAGTQLMRMYMGHLGHYPDVAAAKDISSWQTDVCTEEYNTLWAHVHTTR